VAAAFYGMGVLVAPIIGPTLGGWITDNYSWRWIFFINIPVGILSLVLSSMLIFDPPYMVRRKAGEAFHIDYMGLGLLSLGLGALEVVLDEGQRNDWFGSNFIVWFTVIAVVCLISVVLWELRQKHPVIDFHVLKERNFALCTAAMFLLGVVLYSSSTLLPLFLQTVMGYTATLAGMVVSPGGIATLVAMPIVAVLLKRFSIQPKWLVMVGVAFCCAGLFRMAGFTLDLDYGTAVKSRVVQSLGFAFLFVPINTMAFSLIPRERMNYATGIMNLARNIGGSTGIACATTMLARRGQFHQQRLAEHLTPFDSAYQQSLQSLQSLFRSQGATTADAAAKAQGLLYGQMQRHAAMLSFADVFWLVGILFLAVVPLMFLMKKVAPGKGPMVIE
jgi:MFS transporter, DHA2 family, multidrug resistance protein